MCPALLVLRACPFISHTGDKAATKHAAWWATAARLGARFGPASPGPRVAPTCFAPFRVSTLFQAETTPQPRSERASSARCVRGRCAYDPWHVCGVWAWTDAVSPDRCATCRPRAPRPLPRSRDFSQDRRRQLGCLAPPRGALTIFAGVRSASPTGDSSLDPVGSTVRSAAAWGLTDAMRCRFSRGACANGTCSKCLPPPPRGGGRESCLSGDPPECCREAGNEGEEQKKHGTAGAC